ncbi:MAG: hypothetical protein ABIQ08_13150 [Duganella sp.]
MSDTSEHSQLAEKLSGPVSAILDKHRATITPMLGGSSGSITRAALRDDEAMRKVAGYCYLLLPGLVRLAVKEPAFVGFVLDNRERLLDRLVEKAA